MLEKHLVADQWKTDAPELNFEYHGKSCEYICACYIFIFIFNSFQANLFSLCVVV